MKIGIYCDVDGKTVKKLKKIQSGLKDNRSDMTIEEFFREVMDITADDIERRIKSFQFREGLITVNEFIER